MAYRYRPRRYPRNYGTRRSGRFRNKNYANRKAKYGALTDPFSATDTNPKIPDGKAYDSVGIRLQASKAVETKESGIIDVFLFPGINNGVYVIQRKTGDEIDEKFLQYNGHAEIAVSTNGNTLEQIPEQAISKWRIVSQGLKITSTESDENNDGWYEAIRTMLSTNQVQQMGLIFNTDTQKLCLGPGKDLDEGSIPGYDYQTTNMIDHPTYSTGKITDLDKIKFILKPTGGDHDFLPIDMKWPGDEEHAAKNLVDANWDCILIRLHGRTMSSDQPGSKFWLHVVCNQEIIYDEGSILSRHHTPTETRHLTVKAARRQLHKSKAAATYQRLRRQFGKY